MALVLRASGICCEVAVPMSKTPGNDMVTCKLSRHAPHAYATYSCVLLYRYAVPDLRWLGVTSSQLQGVAQDTFQTLSSRDRFVSLSPEPY